MRGAVRTAAVPGKATAARADWSSAGRREISDNLGGSPAYGKRATRLPEATDDDLMSWVKTLGTPTAQVGAWDMRACFQDLAPLDGIVHIPVAGSEALALSPEERPVGVARIVNFVCDRVVPQFPNGRVESCLAACRASTAAERERAPPWRFRCADHQTRDIRV